jgi:hypothetical protein
MTDEDEKMLRDAVNSLRHTIEWAQGLRSGPGKNAVKPEERLILSPNR